MKKKIDTLLFSGGGMKGIAYVGVIKYFEELSKSDKVTFDIKEICGVSIGSLFGLLYTIGYTYDELYQKVIDIDFSELRKFKISNFISKYGLDNGNKMIDWLTGLMVEKGFTKDTNMRELWLKTRINFRVVAADINTYNMAIFDYKNTPNLKVLKAIRMSTCIPFVFSSQNYNNTYYVDGSVISNYPIQIYENNLSTTLGCKLLSEREIHKDNLIDSFDSYLFNIINCFLINKEKQASSFDKYNEHTIRISAYQITNALNFDLSKSDIQSLIDMGYNSCFIHFLENALIKQEIDNDKFWI
jgi:NTE family protein